MSNDWFTDVCTTLVGVDGRALTGAARDAAEKALQAAKIANHKIWTDRFGNYYHRERSLFASGKRLVDEFGNPVRICGKRVKKAAKFCSSCGSASPGSWWQCSNCSKMIGSESKTCPHCGKAQNPQMRLNLADGIWRKDEDIFAERFDVKDIVLNNGLNIQESQKAILLEGGEVKSVLGAGFYRPAELGCEDDSSVMKSIVMVDHAEFAIPVCVSGIRTADDIMTDLHVVVVLRFDVSNVHDFMRNIMGSSLYLRGEILTASLAYDEIAHCLLADVDSSAREYVSRQNVADLFRRADVRLELEDYIACRLERNLCAIGMMMVRLKEVEFESEVFDRLRELSGQIEAKRKEIEFMQRADELANDATRREAMSEYEMEDYMAQLAHEKGIKSELRDQEVERMRTEWKRTKEIEQLTHEHDLNDVHQERDLDRKRKMLEFEQENRRAEHKLELEKRIAEQSANLDYMNIETQIQDIKIEIEKKKDLAAQESAKAWLEIKKDKERFKQDQKLDFLKGVAGADIMSLIMIEEDPEKRRQLLELHEMQQQSKMTPELLLATAAARGNASAAEALSRMNKDQLDAIEKSKEENKELYERMLQMNERLFNQATENLSKAVSNSGNGNTTQIIK